MTQEELRRAALEAEMLRPHTHFDSRKMNALNRPRTCAPCLARLALAQLDRQQKEGDR